MAALPWIDNDSIDLQETCKKKCFLHIAWMFQAENIYYTVLVLLYHNCSIKITYLVPAFIGHFVVINLYDQTQYLRECSK